MLRGSVAPADRSLAVAFSSSCLTSSLAFALALALALGLESGL